LRDTFKFEFFYSPSELFRAEIKDELNRHFPDALNQLERTHITGDDILRAIRPLVAHQTLLIFTEAYSVVADLACQLDSQDLDSKDFTDQALKLGKQAYLQRRISSESSIAKLLFQNGYQLLLHKGLHRHENENTATERRALAIQIRDMLRRLEAIKAMALTQTLQ
jgi:glycerol-3-phosphate O-acyltransferase